MLFFFLIHQNLVTGGATSLQQTAFPAFYDVFEEPGSQPVQWVLQLCRETISCSRSSHCHLPFADRVTAPLHCGASTAQRAQSTAALSPPHCCSQPREGQRSTWQPSCLFMYRSQDYSQKLNLKAVVVFTKQHLLGVTQV